MPRVDTIVLKGVQLRARTAKGEARRAVDVRLDVDLGRAAFDDQIDRTVDYRRVHECLKRTALEEGDLAENLARAVLDGFPQVRAVEVTSARGGSHSQHRDGAHGARR